MELTTLASTFLISFNFQRYTTFPMIRIQKFEPANPVFTFGSSSFLAFMQSSQVTCRLFNPYTRSLSPELFLPLHQGQVLLSFLQKMHHLQWEIACTIFFLCNPFTQRFTNIRIEGTRGHILDLSPSLSVPVTITNVTLSNIQLYDTGALGYFLSAPNIKLVMSDVRVSGGGLQCMNLCNA